MEIDIKKDEEQKINVPDAINHKQVTIKVKKLHPNAKLPTYATDGSVGLDVRSVDCKYDAAIDTFIYYTGLAFGIPEGYGLFPIPQSRNRKTESYMPNSPGLVDCDYTGEVQFSYKNRDKNNKIQPYKVGDKCGQIVVLPCPRVIFEEVEELEETERGNNGHGSTGEN